MMPSKPLTPIERAIAGEDQDRKARYLQRMQSKGLKRLTVIVPADQVEAFRDRARDARVQFLADQPHD